MQQNHLRWACRRGMLELDLLLERFLATGYEKLSATQQITFERLLTMIDPDLFVWFMGRAEPIDPAFREIVSLIRHE